MKGADVETKAYMKLFTISFLFYEIIGLRFGPLSTLPNRFYPNKTV